MLIDLTGVFFFKFGIILNSRKYHYWKTGCWNIDKKVIMRNGESLRRFFSANIFLMSLICCFFGFSDLNWRLK